MAKQRHGTRFRLRIYARMGQRWAWLCILLILASAAMWWLTPYSSIILPSSRLLTLVPAAIGLIILLYTILARRMAWAQCRPGHLRIQTPLFHLAVSYQRIREVRPTSMQNIFDSKKARKALRGWLKPYAGHTAVVVDLTKYPVSKKWLGIWFNRYLLLPDTPGLVLVVGDWMALSRQIDDYRTRWEMERNARRQETLANRPY